MISEKEARRIAGDWHDGQASPLYAFCSSGKIRPGLLDEIKDRMHNAEIADDLAELFDLRLFVESKGASNGDES